MIQKIKSDEYLRRMNNMPSAEKEDYLKRVGEWLCEQAPLLTAKADDGDTRFLNVIQVSTTWNDAECKAWSEGAVLLSALAATHDTWLPELLYVKSARRSIGQMTECLSRVSQDPLTEPVKTRQPEEPFRKDAGNGVVDGRNKNTEADVKPAVPARPRHIDQYVHLLPEKTQEHAAQYGPTMRELDAARENARRLMEAGEHPDKIAQWAKTVTRLDEKAKAIRNELDAEWKKLAESGRVGVDAFGNAYVIGKQAAAGAEPEKKAETKKPGRPPMTEEEKAAKAAEREAAKKAENLRKAALIRKWLIDKRNAVSEEQKEKWLARYLEMVSLGGEGTVTDKVREAAEYYGVDIPSPEVDTTGQ